MSADEAGEKPVKGGLVSGIVGDVAKSIAGAEAQSDAMSMLKGAAALLGIDTDRAAEWIMLKVATSPRLRDGIAWFARELNEARAKWLFDYACDSMSKSEKSSMRVTAVLVIVLVHKRFPLTGTRREKAEATLRELRKDEDESVRDTAIVVSDKLELVTSTGTSLARIRRDNANLFDALAYLLPEIAS